MNRTSSSITRRGLLGLGAATVGATALSACAGTGGGSKDGGQSGDAQNLQFWSNHPGSSKKIEQELIANFEKQSDGIKVTLVDGGESYEDVQQKFNAALSGGQLPDLVVLSDVTWFNFALNDQLTAIEDVAKDADLDVSGYVEALYNDYKLKDKHYALPYSRSTPLFYYNKTMWQAAGLPDQGPSTWDELVSWCEPLMSKAGAKLALSSGNGVGYLGWLGQNPLWSVGGAYSKEYTPTFTDPATIQGATFLQTLKAAGQYDVSSEPEPVFSSGQAASMLASTGSLKGVLDAVGDSFEVGTAFMPGSGEGNVCPTGGAGIAIPAGISDERKKNAIKVLAFLTNVDSTATFAQGTGYMPVQTAAVDSPTIKEYLQKVPQAQTALDQLSHTRSQDVARVFVPGGDTQIGGAWDKIVAGTEVEKVFGDLQTWMEPKLKTLQEKVG